MSKIENRRSERRELPRERREKSGVWKRCEVGAFNIFLVNLTAPFLFIAELGVQVLSVWMRGRLIFNFISPSLHFIDGMACRRRHLPLTRTCADDLCTRSDCYGTESFSRRYPEAPSRSCPRASGAVSAVDRLLDRSFFVEERSSISGDKIRMKRKVFLKHFLN